MSIIKRNTHSGQKAMKGHSGRFLIALVGSIMIIISLISSCAPQNQSSMAPIVTPQGSYSVSVSSAYDENTVVTLYERVIPAVFEVKTTVSSSPRLFGPFGNNTPQATELGSGFLIDSEGHILTNYHVVENASKVLVTLHDGTELETKVLGTDRSNDIALLQVNAEQLRDIKPLVLGDSSALKPGQMAIALGSPFGLEGSITVGIVSGLGRSITGTTKRSIANIIQTDAHINPGNSGGPLLNSRGEVIGINTAIQADASGIGFAIPINTAKTLLPALVKGEKIKTAWLGIQATPLNAEMAKTLGTTASNGIYVVGITPGSPAETAGLKAGAQDQRGQPSSGGDVVVSIDKVPVRKVEDIIAYLNTKKPGEEVTLTVYRSENKMEIRVKLGEWPE